MPTDRLAKATIDLGAFRNNIRELKSLLVPGVKYMQVMKANAYGHGLEEMAAAAEAEKVDYIGVVSLGEVRRARTRGVKTPLLIMNFIDADSMRAAIELDATLTVYDANSIAAADAAAESAGKTAKLHLKIDTGMHRAGCNPDEALSLAKQIVNAKNVELEGVFVHLAESEDVEVSFTELQLNRFRAVVDELAENNILPPLIHAANSGALIAHPNSHFSMVRPGLAAYGLSPFSAEHPKSVWCEKHLKSVLKLEAPIVYVRSIEPGESVGYNRRWSAQRTTQVGLLPIGYGDGIRRSPHNDGHVIVHGVNAPIIGSISMDQTTIDMTDVPEAAVGDIALLLGTTDKDAISASELAAAYGTINYEVMTSLSARIDRHYIS